MIIRDDAGKASSLLRQLRIEMHARLLVQFLFFEQSDNDNEEYFSAAQTTGLFLSRIWPDFPLYILPVDVCECRW